MGKIGFYTFIFVVLLVGYTNCSEFVAAPELANFQSAQCIAKLRTKSILDVPESMCRDASTYACERRVFGAGAAGPETQSECDGGKCFEVRSFYYDTSAIIARGEEEPSAVEPGGRYNRTEITCYSLTLNRNGETLVTGTGNSIPVALEDARRDCLSRSVSSVDAGGTQ